MRVYVSIYSHCDEILRYFWTFPFSRRIYAGIPWPLFHDDNGVHLDPSHQEIMTTISKNKRSSYFKNMIWSCQNFAHATTAQLSSHVQIFDLIGLFESTLKQIKISKMSTSTLCEMAPWTLRHGIMVFLPVWRSRLLASPLDGVSTTYPQGFIPLRHGACASEFHSGLIIKQWDSAVF